MQLNESSIKDNELQMNTSKTHHNTQNNISNVLSDKEFLEQFESLTLDEELFDHKGHIRLAWLYLNQYDLEKASSLVAKNIKAYAENLGATDKFHTTITIALVRIIQNRISYEKKISWEKFLLDNSDLIDNALSVLAQHYTSELLFSDKARISYLEPDVKPL